MTGQEAGLLCLFSAIVGKDQEIYFPNLDPNENLITFSQIAERFLEAKGFEPIAVSSEEEARGRAKEFISNKQWPCYFFASDTSGEKPFEEFFSPSDNVNWDRHFDLGVIKGIVSFGEKEVSNFIKSINEIENKPTWNKSFLVDLIKEYCPTLSHVETGKFLDGKM